MYTFNFVPEIEDKVFELVARTFPRGAPTMTVLSKRIQARIESIMCHTIVLVPDVESKEFVSAERFKIPLLRRSGTFFATHVHNVCITAEVSKNIIALLLTKYTGIENLALWQSYPDEEPDIVKLLAPLRQALCSLWEWGHCSASD